MEEHSTQFTIANQSPDEARLSGDDGDIYLFQWLSSVERFIKGASADDLKAVQHKLEASLIMILTKGEPYPAPGRALRNITSHCLISLYTHGESKTVFEAVLACLKAVGDHKAPPDRDFHKIASAFCIGEIMASALSAQLTSFVAEIVTVALRTCKSSSNALLRYHALVALRKSLTASRRTATDSATKDILKPMRSFLSDKSLSIRRAAAETLCALYPLPGPDWTASEIEQTVHLCIKGLEGADRITRRALASLVGKALASSQLEAITLSESKKDKGDIDEDTAPSSVASNTPRTILSISSMFMQLSVPFNKPQTSHRIRVGLFDFYSSLLTTLGSAFVEARYSEVIQHFMYEIVSNPRNLGARFDVLFSRKLVSIILRDLIGVRMLGEQAQIGAIQELSTAYLKRWPALMPGQQAPCTPVLAVILREVAGLLQHLGYAPPPVQDALTEPLMTLLAHPSHTVRVHASGALRVLCLLAPLRLSKTLLSCMELLQRDMNLLQTPAAPPDALYRALGHSFGLAALVSIIPSRPLYVSYDISAKIFDTSIQLLKRSGDHDVKLAQVEIEIAWMSIASLMTLGPNFVRAHLPQLLVLWRNALPKPNVKDTVVDSLRTMTECHFLLHVKEAALGAIYCFLRYNTPALVTLDVARRIAAMLSNAFLFISSLPSIAEEASGQNSESLQAQTSLLSQQALLKRRVFQCFSVLGASSVPDNTQTSLIQAIIALAVDPDNYSGSSLQAAIASSSGSFTSLWHTFDNYAYGVTSIITEDSAVITDLPGERQAGQEFLDRDSVDVAIDDLLRRPILYTCEYDPLSLAESLDLAGNTIWPEFPPPASQAVDTGLRLFAHLFPLQDTHVAMRLLSSLTEVLRSPKFDRNAGRKAAARINAVTCIVLALRNAASNPAHAREVFGNSEMSSSLLSFLKDTLVDSDDTLRSTSSEAIGRLANITDSQQFLAGVMKTLVDQVVNNRDPQGRAGCCLALGSIYDHVGSLSAGPLLKTTVNILMSLSKDTHPVVHFWALQSLSRVVNAASLTYAPYVPATLGMLFKIYASPSYELENGPIAVSNSLGDLPTLQAMCKVIDATVAVLGPDIQDAWRTRTIILDLVRCLMAEDDEGIRVEAIRCIQHFLLFAPEHVNVPDLIAQFRLHLKSPRRPLKLASVHALYQLVQRDAVLISKVGGDELVQELFNMLDGDPTIEGVRKIITSWLQQTAIYNPSAWVDLCQKIMSRTAVSHQVVDVSTSTPLLDEESASLSVGNVQDSEISQLENLVSRWRTQLFALRCLHQLCSIIASSNRREQIDLAYARRQGISSQGLLVSRVADLIRMAFTASTTHVAEIRLEGLVVLRDIIEIFAKAPDPDYEDALLMEQYQAPITAALTPAFTSDSTPEILASAVEVCAIFVGCGVVKDAGRMGRILKLLTSALEQCTDGGMIALGDSSEVSPNASAMLRISILSAWAELASAATEHSYLKDVVSPYRAALANLWVVALRDYVSIQAGSETLQEASAPTMDTAYVNLGRDILLPYYADSWPVILHAVTAFMEAGDDHIRAAMNALESPSPVAAGSATNDEPAVLFFVVFGLVYETLSSPNSQSSPTPRGNALQVALMAMKILVRHDYAGGAFLEKNLFDELLSLWYRIAMTEPPTIQMHLIEAIVAFSIGQKTDSTLTKNSSTRMHCLRVCIYVLQSAVFRSKSISGLQSNLADRIDLVKVTLNAIITIATTMDPTTLDEVKAIAISIYGELLKSEASDLDLVGPTLSSLRQLVILPPSQAPSPLFTRVIHGLLSACLLNIDAMKGRQGVLSFNKIKNNLLAAAVVLTCASSAVVISEAVIGQFCLVITEKLNEADDMALTAAYCVKILCTAAASGNAPLRQCIRSLLPGMVQYIVKIAASSERVTVQKHLSATEEVLKAFDVLFLNVVENLRPRFLGVLLPTLVTLLGEDSGTPSVLHSQAITLLLSIASASPAAFRDATARLDQLVRDRVETSMRDALAAHTPTTTQAARPQISLRSF